MTKVNIAALLDAGSHFGHQTRRWNPKMKPYIFGSRGDIYIIDLKKTLVGMDQAYTFVSDLARKGGTILFVGTKKQAQEAVANAANRCGMPYVNARWLGGMLTNFVTIRSRVTHMEGLEAMETDGRMELLPKKEQILLRKELAKLQTNLNGIRNMKKVPDAIFVIDTNREIIAIHEARRLSLPILGMLDTNSDPDDVEIGIPANDDAIRSVALLADFIADAVVAGSTAFITEADMSGKPADQAAKPVEKAPKPAEKAAKPAADAAQAPVAEAPAAEVAPVKEVAEAVEEAAPAEEAAAVAVEEAPVEQAAKKAPKAPAADADKAKAPKAKAAPKAAADKPKADKAKDVKAKDTEAKDAE